MTWTLSAKFAPAETGARWNDPSWASDRTLYRRIRLLPIEVPLIVDHDKSRRLGTVEELFRMDWTDGCPWYIARATLDAEPPAWVQRGCGVSFGHLPVMKREVNIGGVKREIVHDTFVKEISVLHGQRPAEPLAAVLSVKEERPKVSPVAAVATSERFAAGEVLRNPQPKPRDQRTRRRLFSDDEIHARIALAEAGEPGAVEREIEHMRQLEAAARYPVNAAERGLLIRPGIGQVLGVR